MADYNYGLPTDSVWEEALNTSSSFLLQPSQPLPTQTPALPYKAPNSISATGAQPYVSSAQEDAAASGSTTL
ncbi:hypothetical protein A1Q2_05164 [Trichosporon asahii var. asahii CBS 8904]|uniref:Uncharacterized protein n=2 Tax=Trichosporon asahii var. asahii TaxID=189963 RepID=K1WG35_TRIAC|nr:hypothetical protein A1Q1_06501 [Trichosporon asahii var. asahii CBS 2479]EJT45093.1 hypothetical protein A1Q1_06501 [Trichosporon asahii var. asahii CBS 2479]EKD00499.1 hypothetical protein A1Q2_05164 [Trichosporon asahii var. asahii CBS 8904]